MFVLIVGAVLMAALGGLEVASSRAVSAAAAVSAPVDAPPGYWP